MIRVGDTPISDHEINLEAQYHPAASFEAARQDAARALVVRQLLRAEATARGLLRPEDGSDERIEQSAIRGLTEQAVSVPPVSQAQCQAYYQAHQERFRTPTLYAVSHILYGATAGDQDALDHARTQAGQTIEQLQRSPERLEAIARRESACPSGQRGGSLGQLHARELPQTLGAALPDLHPGEVHGRPLQSEHGFHVLRLDARAGGEVAPFDAVRERIELYLRDRAWRQALQSFIQSLAERAGVEGIELQPRPEAAS